MEKLKYHITDMDFSNFRDVYNEAISYYSKFMPEASKEIQNQNLYSTAQKNLPMGWKLLGPYWTQVSEAEAKVFSLRWKYYLVLRERFDKFEKDFGLNQMLTKSNDPDIHYVNILGGEILTYAFYLAAADGSLAIEETAYIESIMHYGLTQSSTLELIKSSSVINEEDRKKYENTAMKSLTIAMLSDRFYMSKPEGKWQSSLAGMLISFLEQFGKGLVGIDGEITKEEQQSIDALINNFKTVSESFANQIKQ